MKLKQENNFFKLTKKDMEKSLKKENTNCKNTKVITVKKKIIISLYHFLLILSLSFAVTFKIII